MRAVIYSEFGGPEVLRVVERDTPVPGPHEVLVKVHVSGVNPTDWKSRRGSSGALPFPENVPNQDGAGVITAVGDAISPHRVGERVWLFEAAKQRPGGTAEEYLAIDATHAVALPGTASFDLGASLGVPALTAHRCLTVGEDWPRILGPDALNGQTVLVAGGAGAVGHAAIELARWSGAVVVTTVSSDEKRELAVRAGAHAVVNYRDARAAEEIRSIAPDGVDCIVEVDSVANVDLDCAVLRDGGTVAIYASGPKQLVLDVRTMMKLNCRLEFVYLYTIPGAAKQRAVDAVADAVAAGVLTVGEEHGLPLVRFPLEDCAAAHRAVEEGAVGKVLLDVGA